MGLNLLIGYGFLRLRVLKRVYNFTFQSLEHGVNFGGVCGTNNLFTKILLDDISFTKRTKRIMVIEKGLLSLAKRAVFFRKQDQDKISFVLELQIKSFVTSNVNRTRSVNVLVIVGNSFR